MTLFVDKLHREKRKDGRRGKETLLSLLPPFPSSLSTYPSLSQLCSAVPTFICCHSYRGAVHFSAPIWFAAQPVTHPPSSPYDWAPFSLSRAILSPRAELRLKPLLSELTPRLSTCLYCLCEQHIVAVFMVSDLVW